MEELRVLVNLGFGLSACSLGFFVLGYGICVMAPPVASTSILPARVQTTLVWLLLLFHTAKGYCIHL